MAMRVDKEKKKVDIYTDRYKITGYIHVLSRARLTDAIEGISKQSKFLPVTDAVIVFNDGTRKEVDFLLVRINEIEMITQTEEE